LTAKLEGDQTPQGRRLNKLYRSTYHHYCGINLLHACTSVSSTSRGRCCYTRKSKDGNFPLAYTYPNEMRATRDLLRRRFRIVQHGAMLKTHVVNTTSQYNPPPNKVNLKNVGVREQVQAAFAGQNVQHNINLDLAIIECYHRELSKLEEHLERQAKQHNPTSLSVLRTIPGVGRILALTILYEIGDIQRFESVQKFASYARLINCKAESAGKMDPGHRKRRGLGLFVLSVRMTPLRQHRQTAARTSRISSCLFGGLTGPGGRP